MGQSIDTLLLQQDSIPLTLAQSERLFLEKNFQLLAERYNVDMAKAAVIQARLWINPSFFFEHVLYNPHNKEVFDRSSTNEEIVIQLQQMIALAGKRSKLIRLAETNVQLERLAFEDLLRVLRFQLYNDYISVFYGLKTLNILKIEEAQLNRLIAASQIQYSQGAISGYELTRVEFEVQSIRADIRDQLKDILDKERELKMMLRIGSDKFILPQQVDIRDTTSFSYATALDSAFKNRPDYKTSNAQAVYQNQNLQLARAMAVPNAILGTTYDRLGNAFPNYFGLNVQFDLPIFNRNQGNIRIAELQLEVAKRNISNTELLLEQEVVSAYDQVILNGNVYKRISENYRSSLLNISTEAVVNYQRRIIGLLDFIDKIRTYKYGMLSIFNNEMNYYLSKQYFNFVTNSKFY